MTMATLSNWNQTQQILLAVAGIPAGVMSFLASATIVIMIFRSPTKLKNPFRRIIFSISCYDSIQSMVFVFAAFLSPVGSTWGAMGNTYTCNLFGCLFHVSEIVPFLLDIVNLHANQQNRTRVAQLSWIPAVYFLVSIILYVCYQVKHVKRKFQAKVRSSWSHHDKRCSLVIISFFNFEWKYEFFC